MGEPEHWFESAGHRSEFVEQVSRGEVSLKFAYAGSSARTHLRLARSEGYETVTRRVDLELRALASVSRRENHTLVDVGPGDGRHTKLLLEQVRQLGVRVHGYFGVDFSRILLSACSRELAPCWSAQDIEEWAYRVHDVEMKALLRVETTRPRLFALLGSVLGNVADPVSFLGNATRTRIAGDSLIVSVAARPAERERTNDEWLLPYTNATFEDAVLEPFLAAGVLRDQMVLRLESAERAVRGIVKFRNAVRLMSGHGFTPLPRGHEVRCFTSRRFSSDEVSAVIVADGWSVVELSRDEAGIAILATA